MYLGVIQRNQPYIRSLILGLIKLRDLITDMIFRKGPDYVLEYLRYCRSSTPRCSKHNASSAILCCRLRNILCTIFNISVISTNNLKRNHFFFLCRQNIRSDFYLQRRMHNKRDSSAFRKPGFQLC